jgi:hypothetical protein
VPFRLLSRESGFAKRQRELTPNSLAWSDSHQTNQCDERLSLTAGRVVVCQNDDSLFSTHRIEDPHGCYALPLGKWGTLQLGLHRLAKDRIMLSIEMNGFKYSTKHKYTREDNIDKRMPHYIDTVALMCAARRTHAARCILWVRTHAARCILWVLAPRAL